MNPKAHDEIELNSVITDKKKRLMEVLASCENKGLSILPYEQLKYLQENISLINLKSEDINKYVQDIEEIINQRSNILNKDFAYLSNLEPLNLNHESSEKLQILVDNIALLKLNDERKIECKTAILQTLKLRQPNNNSWTSYFLKQLKDISNLSLNAVKTATDAIIYITGTPVVNKAFNHAEICLKDEHEAFTQTTSNNSSELQRLQEKQQQLSTILNILNDLKSSAFDQINGDKLIFLRDNLNMLNLNPETEKNFKSNLDRVILKRLNAVSELLDINLKSGMDFLNLDQLKMLKDNIKLIPLERGQRDALEANIIKQIDERMDHEDANQASHQVENWLGLNKLTSNMKSIFCADIVL